jgi:ribosome recycling factor
MQSMAYDFTNFKAAIVEGEEWLRRELSLLRTGRATSAILDAIYVESYGSMSPIAHVASITMEDPRTIRVAPWDKSQVKSIEQAITKANLGLSVSADDAGLRISFPELTGERREQVVKILKSKLEDARVTVRKAREEVITELKQLEKDGGISEDEHFKAKEDMQKLVEASNHKFDEMAARKEQEIRN